MFNSSEFIGEFRAEARDHLAKLSEGLVSLEAHPDQAGLLDELFRSAHTIKGSARMMGLEQINQLAHLLEDALAALRSHQAIPQPALFDAMLAVVDALGVMVDTAPEISVAVDAERLSKNLHQALTAERASIEADSGFTEAGQATANVPLLTTAGLSSPEDTIRLSVGNLDELMNLAGELVVLKMESASHLSHLKRIAEASRRLSGIVKRLEAQSSYDSTRITAITDELSERVNQAIKSFRQATSAANQIIDELQTKVMESRLTPVGALFASAPRLVRDLCRQRGKQVELIIEGSETELDRKILAHCATRCCI